MKEKKKIIILLALILVVISSSSCMNKNNENNSKLEGLYYYDYLDDSAELVEDHYILIESKDKKLVGYYYGTTDDFDEAREGYYPGYYVSEMKNLKIINDSINFSIQLFENDIFSKPVDLEYNQSANVPKEINQPWINSQIFSGKDGLTREYSGALKDTDIIITIDNEPRVFKKIK